MSDDNGAPAENAQVENAAGQEDKTKCTVYVGSLSWSTNEDGLKAAFEKYGNIVSARIPRNDRDQSKGFGFVEFENEEDAKKACKMDGTELDGRALKVNISQPKSEGRGRDRRGGDRRGGDRYGDRRGGDRYGGDRRGGDRYGGDRRGGRNDRHGGY